MEASLEQTLQEGKLFRQINELIVAHLRDNNLNQVNRLPSSRITSLNPVFGKRFQLVCQAAAAAASATMIPLNTDVPPNRLFELVAKGLAVEREEVSRGVSFSSLLNSASGIPAAHGSLPLGSNAIDFRRVTLTMLCLVCDIYIIMHNTKGSSKTFPKHETKHVSDHKKFDSKTDTKCKSILERYAMYLLQNVARCARFSRDGRFVATGSSDTSIKLFEVSKTKQSMLTDARDGPVRPVIRTFYDHSQPINDLDFHPQNAILISGAKDNTIKFFDFSKTVARRAVRVIQDTHNVRSVSFHPSGEYLLAVSPLSIFMLIFKNLASFKASKSFKFQALVVRYSSTGSMYVTASKDGSLGVWDGVTAQCIRPIVSAHGSMEATSASFTKDQRFILSCGKDSTVKLWEVGTGRLVKQYLGAVHKQQRCQAVFNDTEEFVLSIDEPNNEVVIWDALTAEKVAMWPSNHSGSPRWIDHSPTEAAFVTCGGDWSVRFWKEIQIQ
ncbi:hypothetical protein ZIOFF_058714 [Zingiber officinale]|uniref:Cleavage stimulation factor 50 kDa subunit n=1 Tax=Zingiber officinale TaxID=94328 RepID=A0A8J5KJK1_ZINOF|nr:hypothetical protein ZIOFF_058714 [Zingiber officinale]